MPLYEAVIYFIIGGRGRYNPRLGNEAIYEEAERARSSARAQQKFDRSDHPGFIDRAVSLARFTAANRNYSSRKSARIRASSLDARDGARLFRAGGCGG